MPKSPKDDSATSASTVRQEWSRDHIPWNKKGKSVCAEQSEQPSFVAPDGEEIFLRKGEELVWIKESVKRERIPYIKQGEKLLTLQQYRDLQMGEVAEANYQRLADIDEKLADMYWVAASEVRELAEIALHLEHNYDQKTLEITGGFFSQPGKDEQYLHATIPIRSTEYFRKYIVANPDSAEVVVRLYSSPFGKAPKDPHELRNFMAMREIGRVIHFVQNYLDREPIFDRAYFLYRKVRAQQLNMLPLPGCTPIMMHEMQESGDLKRAFTRHKKYFRQIHIKSEKQLLEIGEREYHRLPCEMRPNSFAARLMRLPKQSKK